MGRISRRLSRDWRAAAEISDTIRVASRVVEKQLAAVPSEDRERVIPRIRTLVDEPRPKGLKALAPGVYRLRVGRHRTIYKVFDREQVILLGRIARRTERTYQHLEALF